jgi:hypothetical protein
MPVVRDNCHDSRIIVIDEPGGASRRLALTMSIVRRRGRWVGISKRNGAPARSQCQDKLLTPKQGIRPGLMVCSSCLAGPRSGLERLSTASRVGQRLTTRANDDKLA